jgi:guanylate kinase
MKKGRLCILSGPSCVGKSPLLKALRQFDPELTFGRIVLYTSRAPRSIEKDGVDFHFRDQAFIRALPSERYIIGQVRHIWQAIDLKQVSETFLTHSLILLELHPDLVKPFLSHDDFKTFSAGYEVVTIFISPLTRDEIRSLCKETPYRGAGEAVAAVMTPKLISRALQQGTALTPAALEDIRIRASHAHREIEEGEQYDHVLINHDGEDSLHWRYTPPVGEAGATLARFHSIITKDP